MARQFTHTDTPATRAVLLLLLAALLQACGGGGSADPGGDDGGGPGGGGAGGQNAAPPLLGISAAEMSEGNAGVAELLFQVVLSGPAAGDVTVDYASAAETATAGEDFTEVEDTLTIPAGQTAATIAVPVTGDDCFEEDETFSITLDDPSSNVELDAAAATGTIRNDDNPIAVAVADSEIPEGNDGTSDLVFTIGLDRAGCYSVKGTYTTNSVTADEQDVAIETGSFSIAAGEVEGEIVVAVTGDTEYETDETLTLNLENVSDNAIVSEGEAFGTIRTDDLPPVEVSGADILEGDDGSRTMIFPVELAGITNEISVDYATSDLTATVADHDYVEAHGTLTIPAGTVETTIEVEITGDTRPEGPEKFLVTLSNLAGDAVLEAGSDRAEGTIEDDDVVIVLDPEITVPPTFGFEGDDPAVLTDMLFQVTLNVPVAGEVVLDYRTQDLNAVAGTDYESASGRVTIPAGETEALVPVGVRGDVDAEDPESFVLELELVSGPAVLVTPEATGTILDDDGDGLPFLSVQQVSIFEGDDGIRDLAVYVTLTGPANGVVTVDYATRDATALAGSDYESASGTLTFQPGETVQTFTVAVIGDTVIEADERFEVDLSNMTGDAILFADVADATIRSDDPFAMVSIDDVVLVEGDSGVSDMLFTVSLDAAAVDAVTMDYATADVAAGNSATAGDDYVAADGTLTFLPGELEATIAVQVNGDDENEFDESFEVTLANVSQNAEFADPVGEGRIVNDDEMPGWGLPQFFGPADAHDILPAVAMNAAGEAMAIWATSSPVGQFTGSRYAGGWGAPEHPPENLVSGDTRADRVPFIDGAGLSTLLWAPMPEAARHSVAGGWDTSAVVLDPTSTNDAHFVALAGNEAGSVVAVWKQDSSGSADHLEFSVYDPVAGQWSPAGYIVLAGGVIFTPDVAMNGDGAAVAVWREGSTRASVYDPATGVWSVPVEISAEVLSGFHQLGYSPQVAIDGDGDAIAVWDSGESLGTAVIGDVWFSRYDAASGQWSEAEPLDLDPRDATHPQIAMDAAGNAFVVWMHDNDGTTPFNDSFEIRARRYDAASGAWGPEVLVHDSNTRASLVVVDLTLDALDLPALAVDPAGNALLAWSEDINGELVIRASRYDAMLPQPGWSAPEPVSDGTYAFAMLPEIAVDAAGNAIVVWQASDDGTFDPASVSRIGWNRYTAP